MFERPQGIRVTHPDAVARRAPGHLAHRPRQGELHLSGVSPFSNQAQQYAAAHAAWFAQIPGTPEHAGDLYQTRAMLNGMAKDFSWQSQAKIYETLYSRLEA